MLDINAQIVPFDGIGSIKLGSHIRDNYRLLQSFRKFDTVTGKDLSATVYETIIITFELQDTVRLSFNILNGRLFKISVLKKYKGCLYNNIFMGQPIERVLQTHPQFIFNEDEELYEGEGVTLEASIGENVVEAITIFSPEALDWNEFLCGSF